MRRDSPILGLAAMAVWLAGSRRKLFDRAEARKNRKDGALNPSTV